MLVSIVTVNYNDRKGLERTLKSVHEQTYVEFEHIVIDGGSNDGSKHVIEEYVSYLNYWVSEPDNGIYHAMNKGIAIAKGDYLLFLNSGDHFYNDKSLHFLSMAAIQENRPSFVFGNIFIMSEIPFVKHYPAVLDKTYFLVESLPHPATLIKRTCFDNGLYDTRFKIVADWKFFIEKIAIEKNTYFYVNEIISTFYLDGVSNSNLKQLKKERLKIIKKVLPGRLKQFKELSKVKRSDRFGPKLLRRLNHKLRILFKIN